MSALRNPKVSPNNAVYDTDPTHVCFDKQTSARAWSGKTTHRWADRFMDP
jgi:hypothetical protein